MGISRRFNGPKTDWKPKWEIETNGNPGHQNQDLLGENWTAMENPLEMHLSSWENHQKLATVYPRTPFPLTKIEKRSAFSAPIMRNFSSLPSFDLVKLVFYMLMLTGYHLSPIVRSRHKVTIIYQGISPYFFSFVRG